MRPGLGSCLLAAALLADPLGAQDPSCDPKTHECVLLTSHFALRFSHPDSVVGLRFTFDEARAAGRLLEGDYQAITGPLGMAVPSFMASARLTVIVTPTLGRAVLGRASAAGDGRAAWIAIHPPSSMELRLSYPWPARTTAANTLFAATLAHEIFHVFQFGYAVHGHKHLKEWTATWAERRLVRPAQGFEDLVGYPYYEEAWQANLRNGYRVTGLTKGQQYAMGRLRGAGGARRPG